MTTPPRDFESEAEAMYSSDSFCVADLARLLRIEAALKEIADTEIAPQYRHEAYSAVEGIRPAKH